MSFSPKPDPKLCKDNDVCQSQSLVHSRCLANVGPVSWAIGAPLKPSPSVSTSIKWAETTFLLQGSYEKNMRQMQKGFGKRPFISCEGCMVFFLKPPTRIWEQPRFRHRQGSVNTCLEVLGCLRAMLSEVL